MLWGMSRIGTEERKQTRFSSRGRDCTGLVEVLMIFLALFLSGAARKPSSCSCARAFRMVPLPVASALLSSRSPGMTFVNCPDRRRCFNLATVLDWAVSPGHVLFMGGIILSARVWWQAVLPVVFFPFRIFRGGEVIISGNVSEGD